MIMLLVWRFKQRQRPKAHFQRRLVFDLPNLLKSNVAVTISVRISTLNAAAPTTALNGETLKAEARRLITAVLAAFKSEKPSNPQDEYRRPANLEHDHRNQHGDVDEPGAHSIKMINRLCDGTMRFAAGVFSGLLPC